MGDVRSVALTDLSLGPLDQGTMGLTLLRNNPFRKLHEAAFSSAAVCPSCHGDQVRLLETLNHGYVYRWQCKNEKCGQIYREDLTPRGYYGDQDARTREVGDPYASFKGLRRPTRRLEDIVKPAYGTKWNVGVHRFKK